MPVALCGVGLLVLGGIAFLVLGRRGPREVSVVAARPAAPPPWVPTGPAAASADVWRAALRAWRPTGSPDEIDTSAALVRAANQSKPFREAATALMREGTTGAHVHALVKSVDGSVWRTRPAYRVAKWKGQDAYRHLDTLAAGGLVVAAALGSTDRTIAAVEQYDRSVESNEAARENDDVRARADPAGRGFCVDVEKDGCLWLAGKDVGAAGAEPAVAMGAAGLASIWAFAAKVPMAEALRTQRIAFVFDPTSPRYLGLDGEGTRIVGLVRLPYGDAIETKLAGAAALVLGAYDAAFRLGCNRNRENLRPALAMRWGLAFANYPGDLAPDSFPVMRDRGMGALKKALGTSPKVPSWGEVLDAALKEDVRQTEQARISDMDPVRRAAYVFLGYRMIMRWRIFEPWTPQQMRALAEGKPIPFGDDRKTRHDLSWSDFATALKAVADDPLAATRYREGQRLLQLNHLFSSQYVPWVLAGEPAGGAAPDSRGR